MSSPSELSESGFSSSPSCCLVAFRIGLYLINHVLSRSLTVVPKFFLLLLRHILPPLKVELTPLDIRHARFHARFQKAFNLCQPPSPVLIAELWLHHKLLLDHRASMILSNNHGMWVICIDSEDMVSRAAGNLFYHE